MDVAIDSPPDLQTELASLKAQLASTTDELRDSQLFVNRILEMTPDVVTIFDVIDGRQVYANRELTQVLGYTLEDVQRLGAQITQMLVHPDDIPAALAQQRQLQTIDDQTVISIEQRMRHADGSWRWMLHRSRAFLRDPDGRVRQIIGTSRDISDQKNAELERIQLQEQVIAAQQAALRELSTPLIPISNGVVAMPLVGSIDSARAQQIVETLLEGVSNTRAATAIVDITGVPVVDTQVANTLLRAAQAVQLLGAKVVLTGIRPEVAQTLVNLGIRLDDIVTRATLQSGVAWALTRTSA